MVMPVAEISQLLNEALLETAHDNGFDLGDAAAKFIVDYAVRSINRQTESDVDRFKAAELAIVALPFLVNSVKKATSETSFRDAASVRKVMQTKTCSCPFPWGY